MGTTASSPRKRSSFSGIVPASQTSKRSNIIPKTSATESLRPAASPIPALAPPPSTLDRLQTPSFGLVAPRLSHENASDPFAVPESVRKSRTLEQFDTTCSEIVPGLLFVSNLRVAQDTTQLQSLGITHVVSCCKEVACLSSSENNSISYLQLALRDGVQEDLLPFFPQVIVTIESAQQQNGKVLLNCHQGVSRSCALAIAYVMYTERCGFHAAAAMVKAKRAISSPNAAFICQLLEWERELTTFGSVTTSDGSSTATYGLYRVAPHAAYDTKTLVLKLCYEKDSRRKVVVETSDGIPIPRSLLWSQGTFVFLNHHREVVIWKGAKCTIENAVAQVRDHIDTMLQVYVGSEAKDEIQVVVVEDGRGDCSTTETDEDRFGYAAELDWSINPPPAEPRVMAAIVHRSDSSQQERVPSTTTLTKPMLFLMASWDAEDEQVEATWEQLTNYDADDLLAQDVLLLVTATKSFLWVGGSHAIAPVTLFQPAALVKATEYAPSTELLIENQDIETEAFWEAFEAGY